jgi:hypothetical protein
LWTQMEHRGPLKAPPAWPRAAPRGLMRCAALCSTATHGERLSPRIAYAEIAMPPFLRGAGVHLLPGEETTSGLGRALRSTV